MDLQTERRVEQFLQLAGLPVTRIEPRMEFIYPPFRLYVESIENRILLSMAAPLEHGDSAQTLKRLLGRCHPGRTLGIPIRAYLLREYQVLSCTLTLDSDVGHWLACQNTLRQLLETRHRGS